MSVFFSFNASAGVAKNGKCVPGARQTLPKEEGCCCFLFNPITAPVTFSLSAEYYNINTILHSSPEGNNLRWEGRNCPGRLIRAGGSNLLKDAENSCVFSCVVVITTALSASWNWLIPTGGGMQVYMNTIRPTITYHCPRPQLHTHSTSLSAPPPGTIHPNQRVLFASIRFCLGSGCCFIIAYECMIISGRFRYPELPRVNLF